MLAKLKAAVGIAPKRRSSPEVSSLAARILSKRAKTDPNPDGSAIMEEFNDLLRDAKKLAGSVLSQDEFPGD